MLSIDPTTNPSQSVFDFLGYLLFSYLRLDKINGSDVN